MRRDTSLYQSSGSVILKSRDAMSIVERDTTNVVERTRVGTFKLKNSVDHLNVLLQQLPGADFDPVSAGKAGVSCLTPA